MFISGILFTIIIIIFHWSWIRSYDYWKKRGFPYIPGKFPFGTLRELALRTRYLGKMYQDLYDKFAPQPYAGIYIWKNPYLLIRDPEMVRNILIKDFAHFRDRGFIATSAKNDPLSQNLFHIDGDLWRRLRVKMTPTFSSKKMKDMFTLFKMCANEFYGRLDKIVEEGTPVSIKHLIMNFTLDVITSSAFGLDLNAGESTEFRKICGSFVRPYVRLRMKFTMSIYAIFPSFSKLYTFPIIEKHMTEFIISLVENTMKYREKNAVKRNDFLDLLMQLKINGKLDSCDKKEKYDLEEMEEENDPPLEMTKDLLAAQCFVFLVAGFESSSTVVTFSLYELALNPDIQRKLHSEIDATTRGNPADISYETLRDMVYLDQIVSETLRKYPVAPTLLRTCTKDYTMPDRPDLTLEKGTKVLIPVYSLQHDPNIFPDPQKFDPERFSPENKHKIHPSTYLPFGDGPRFCIGMRFGQLQAKMALYTVMSKYQVIATKDTIRDLDFGTSSVVTTVKSDIKLLIKRR